MRVTVVHPREIGGGLAETWEGLRARQPHLANPFYAPGLMRLLGEVRCDLRVAVVEDGAGRLEAIMPLHRGRWGLASLAGFPLMDHHGLIAPPGADVDLPTVLQGCGVRMLRFLHVPADDPNFSPHIAEAHGSPLLRLRGGEVASHSLKKLRKMGRNLGEVEFRAADPAVSSHDLDRLLGWKRRQIDATHFYRVFEHAWIEPLLRRLVEPGNEVAGGVFSTLRVGGRLVAAHLGLRSDRVWHWWFPGYDPDPELAKYSPGLMLMLLMIDAAPSLGIEWIDFGTGSEAFKARFANGAIALGQGGVTAGWMTRTLSAGHALVARSARRHDTRWRLRRVQRLLQPSF